MHVVRGGARFVLATALFALAAAVHANETVKYKYDALGRLVESTSTGTVNTNVGTSVSYDPAGNRSNYSVTGVVTGPSIADWSFEIPVQASGGYAYTPSVAGAVFTGGSGVAANGSAWGFASAPAGNQAAFIAGVAEGHGRIVLDVSGLTTGATYVLRFHGMARPGYDANPINVSFNGTSLGTFTPNSASFVQATTPSFVAGAATGTISFDGTSTASYTASGIDAVTIAPGPAVADWSFEDPPQNGGYTYTPSVAGTLFTGGSGVAGNGSAWGFATAPAGNQAAFIAGVAEGHGKIVLDVSGLTTGATYVVRFHGMARPGYDANPINVSFNGTSLGTFTPNSASFVQATTASFVAGAATGTITFDGTSTASYTASGIDGVTLALGGS